MTGSPIPKMTWTKNGVTLKPTSNLDLNQSPDFCKIKLKKAGRGDAGEYQVELENDSGKETVPITIKVIGKYYLILTN